MTLRNFALIVALAGSAVFQSSNAGTVPFPTDGDLFMGFRSTTASNEYLWDIGQYTQFDGKPVGFHLTLFNIQTDLTTVFGSSWVTDINVQWGSAGTLDASSKLFASKAEPSVGVFAQPWPRQSTSSQTLSGSMIDTMAFGDFAGQEASPNNPNAVIHSATSAESWASWNNGSNSPGGSFGTWVPTVEAPQAPGSGSGIVNTRLDFFRIDPDNTGTNPPSTYMGTLSIDAAGNVNFDVNPPLPVVSMTVTDGSASKGPPVGTGTINIARTGATTSSLQVLYTVGGTAKNGKDYMKLKGNATIKARQASVNVVITPITDNKHTPDKTVILTLKASATYTIGSPNTGTVVIHDP
jgi:hypothetical protein